ncbi:MAG TPA: DUF3300 domain-containing protein [Casimicrobiaceae bacterium]
MQRLLKRLLAIAFATLAALAGSATAQAPDVQAYSQDELDQLLAPIALYPDELLTQILVASTYPLEVVEAARFVEANPQLQGGALDDAVAGHNWDPSVQSLTAFPQVLSMMNDKLEWTERLGDAFLADEQRVMGTVQALRRRAEATGNLEPTPQQSVAEEDQVIVIAPAQPDVVYVPVYDPRVVYGPWWVPGYPPWFWYPPPIYGYPVYVGGIAFGIGWRAWPNHWGWCRPDWHHHHVVLDTGRNRFWNDRPRRPPPPPGQVWQHSPYHRRGVPYADVSTRERYRPVNPGAVRDRQNYRGYATPAPARAVPPAIRQAPGASAPPRASAPPPVSATPRALAPPPASAPPRVVVPPPSVRAPQVPSVRQAPVAPRYEVPRPTSPSIFEPGASRGQAQTNAQRGMQSLRSVPPGAAPSARAPAPAPRSVPAPRSMPTPPARGR